MRNHNVANLVPLAGPIHLSGFIVGPVNPHDSREVDNGGITNPFPDPHEDKEWWPHIRCGIPVGIGLHAHVP